MVEPTRPAVNRTSIIMLLAFLGLSFGCVRRRLTVRTNPAGASVYVDKQPIGTSPISTSFVYYGTREIEVVADGYRTEKVLRNISPPWYQLPPLDFLAETLWPWEVRDERVIDITMVPREKPASEVLQARADGMRIQASQGIGVPLPVTSGILPGTMLGEPGQLPPVANPALVPPVTPPPQVLPPGSMHGLSWPESIPEAGILPGGGYRPSLDDPALK